MTARDFAYWLQGFFELNESKPGTGLSDEQTATIARHLAMVFRHEIDPSFGKDKEALQEIHDRGDGDTLPGCQHDVKFTC